MGQTLTHGIYLPDEGERNCYSGLAANWQLLDGAVGTVAEHTTALAGKAPAVHTHVKADITDLFNSNFIPSANNSYDLGSSSYQWNNMYAKSYYYNGVAWGLDKVNTWSAQQKIVGNNSRGVVSIYNPTYTKGSALSSTDLSIGSIYMGDGGQQGLSNSLTFISTDLAANGARTLLSLSAMENTASSGARTNVVIQYDKNDAENPKKVSIGGTVQPNPDATFSLGSSSYRWKTLNGVNPGALSLPDMSSGTGVSLSAGSNSYSPPSSGWLSINLTGAISVVCGNFCHSGTDMLSVPVVKGSTYTVTVATSGTAYLFVSQGNV